MKGFGSLVAGLALAAGVSVCQADTYTVDYFPDEPVDDLFQSLLFAPELVDPTITGKAVDGARVVFDFTTPTVDELPDGATPFDAAFFTLQLSASIPDGNGGEQILIVTGADLGWSGQGHFTADFVTHDLDGKVESGVWTWNTWGEVNEELGIYIGWSGEFSAGSGVTLNLVPQSVPEPTTAGLLAIAGAAVLRRRR